MDSTHKMAGPLLIGYLLNLCLLGILLVQVFIYSAAFNKPKSRDRIWLRLLVYLVVLLEVIQSAFILGDAYTTFAWRFGNPEKLDFVQFTWLTMPVLGGIVGCIVQIFYAFRIYVLSGHAYVLPLFIVLLAVTQCAASIVVGVDEYYGQKLTVLTQAGKVGNYIWPTVSAGCDVIIAVATSYYLIKVNNQLKDSHGGEASIPTRTILGRTLHLAVDTGAMTAALSIIYLALWVSYPMEYFYMTFAFILGKVYANSLMVILNSRVMISDLRDEPRFFGSKDSLEFRSTGGGACADNMMEISVNRNSIMKRSFERPFSSSPSGATV